MTQPSSNIRGASPVVKNAAKALRKRLTPAEAILWEALRRGGLEGLKFRRQHPVGRFILDFYCPAYKLVVEVDGKVHETQMEYDSARTSQLEAHGYKILRFSNEAVMQELDGVLTEILEVVGATNAKNDQMGEETKINFS
jgi:very-short-patch-repair endonuclease